MTMEKLILSIAKQTDRFHIKVTWASKRMEPFEFDREVPTDLSFDAEEIVDSGGDLRELGKRLFSSIFRDKLETIYRTMLDSARRTSQGLALCLVLDEFSASYPWELMCDRNNPHIFLILDPSQALIRVARTERPPNRPEARKPLSLPVRVLHIVANPSDQDSIGTSALPDSLQDLRDRGMILIDQITGPSTLQQLNQKALENAQADQNHSYSILHIEAHGSNINGLGQVFFCNADNHSMAIGADELSNALSGFQNLRIAVLNTCMSGEVISEFKYGSLARSLAASGIPVVIAMNGSPDDDYAQYFFKTFLEQSIYAQKPVAIALTRARQAMVALGGSESLFYVPTLYSTHEADSALELVFDPTQIDTKVLEIATQCAVEVPKQVWGTGDLVISILSIGLDDKDVEIGLEATLKSEEGDYQIELARSNPQLIAQRVKLTTSTSDHLAVSNSQPLHRKLRFSGTIPPGTSKVSLEFNSKLEAQSNKSPHVLIENIPLPLGARRTRDTLSAPSIQSYSNPEWKALIENCPDREAFVKYCFQAKEKWQRAEQWLRTGLLESWADEFLVDAELSDFIRQALGASREAHRALWTILTRLDASLTTPQVHVNTGRRDGSVLFKNVMPGRKIVADVKLYHYAPRSYLSGKVKSSREWLLLNGMESYYFKNHTDDGPLTISFTVSATRFLFSTFPTSPAGDSAEVIIEFDPEYARYDMSQQLKIPVVLSIESLPFLLAFSLPVALGILLMVGIYLWLSSRLEASASWILYAAILCGSLPLAIALIHLIHTRVLLRILDLLQKE